MINFFNFKILCCQRRMFFKEVMAVDEDFIYFIIGRSLYMLCSGRNSAFREQERNLKCNRKKIRCFYSRPSGI